MCFSTKNVFFSMYPSYVFSLIMGLAPFKIYSNGSLVKVEYMKLYQLISTLLYAFFIGSLLVTNYSSIGYYRLQTPMERFINFLYSLLVVGLLSVNVIFNKIHTNSLIKLWEKIYQIDYLIKNHGIKLNYKKIMALTLAFCVIGSSLHTGYIIFLVYIQSYKDPIFSCSVYFALNFTVQGFVCVSCSFYSFFLVIGHMFEKVLDYMENNLLKNHRLDLDSKLNSILNTSLLHQELCAVARLANNVTSVQMLSSFAVAFGMITLQIYSIVTAFNIKKINYNFVLSSLACAVILLTGEFIISLVSQRCMGMAGSAIATYIMLFIQADPFVDLYQSMKETVGAM